MKARIIVLIAHLKKISLASVCLMFMIATIPIVEKDIDWLQGQKDKLVTTAVRLEIINNQIDLKTLIPGTPGAVIQRYQDAQNKNKPILAEFWSAIKIIDDYIDKLKNVKMALLIVPVIIFTLADIYRVGNEPKIARYMVYTGIVTVISLLIIREFVWSTLRSSLPS